MQDQCTRIAEIEWDHHDRNQGGNPEISQHTWVVKYYIDSHQTIDHQSYTYPITQIHRPYEKTRLHFVFQSAMGTVFV